MLASLLPGLRELRTPLTVGYLWLICVWLWFHDLLPQRSTAHGAIKDLYDLASLLPSASALAAVTFTAYFLGSIIELDPATARWLDGLRPNRTSWEAVADRVRFRLDDPDDLPSERFEAAVAAWERAAPSRTRKRVSVDKVELEPEERARFDPAQEESARTLVPPPPYNAALKRLWRSDPGSRTSGRVVEWRGADLPIGDDTVQQLSAPAIATLVTLSDELPDLATRLLIERPEVFDTYDRLLAEASLRINMFAPLVALVSTLALRAHWLWWSALVVCAAVLNQGLVQRSRAVAVILDSIATQLIESPTMAAVATALRGEGSS
ncbi:hypothetical protein ABZ896_06610 [Streptomyces sp. NPDC047072]|uniref:hypothetical protein n=1 Tax=Streptomyces sp. NPDC047072 TaxID=3154809 RepID=UPI0033FBD812